MNKGGGLTTMVPDHFSRIPGGGRDPRTGSDPLVVRLELQAELVIEDPQIAVPAARNRLRHDDLHFLRHDADVGFAAAVIAEAIKAKAVVEAAQERDVVLERDVGPPSATAAAAAAATTAGSHTSPSP